MFDMPRFFEKEPFLDLLYCNGGEDVDPALFSEPGRMFLREFVDAGIIEESTEPLPPLKSYQRYRIYPSRYLESAHWSITGKCNFHCRHCLVSAPDANLPQLPLEDIFHIVRGIADCGIKRVDITGGEPLFRTDLEQIVEAISKYGLRIGVVFTNASLLDNDVLDMFERHGQRPGFQMSFDGLGHHDWLRGVAGAEKAADTALRLLQEREYPVSVAMCIHRGNRDSLRNTVRYLASLGVRSLRVNAPQEFGSWKRYSQSYALTEDEVWESYREYIPQFFADGMPVDIELDGYFFCKKGQTDYRVTYASRESNGFAWNRIPYCESMRYNMHIGSNGRIYPCMAFSDSALSEVFPSSLEQPLGKITLSGVSHDVVETKVADLLARNPECSACGHLPNCMGGCMVQSMSEEGDYLIPDQRCCYFHKHIGEAAVREIADAAIALQILP